MSSIGNIIQKVIQKRKYNILYLPYDGKIDMEIFKTNHNFFVDYRYCAYPPMQYTDLKYDNLYEINESNIFVNQYDFMVCSHVQNHQQFASIANQLHLPVLFLHHEKYDSNPFFFAKIKQQVPHEEAFISYPYQETKTEEKDIPLLIIGNDNPTFYYIVNTLKAIVPNLICVGFNNLDGNVKLSDFEQYKELISKSKIVLSLCPTSVFNYELFLSRLYKCALVCGVEDKNQKFLESNKNCYASNNAGDLIQGVKNLIYDKSTYERIANYKDDYTNVNTTKTFIEDMNKIFDKIADRSFIK